MHKQNVIYRNNGILFNHEENPTICNGADRPERHFTRRNESDTERQTVLIAVI